MNHKKTRTKQERNETARAKTEKTNHNNTGTHGKQSV
jgi:hypothetical protein